MFGLFDEREIDSFSSKTKKLFSIYSLPLRRSLWTLSSCFNSGKWISSSSCEGPYVPIEIHRGDGRQKRYLADLLGQLDCIKRRRHQFARTSNCCENCSKIDLIKELLATTTKTTAEATWRTNSKKGKLNKRDLFGWTWLHASSSRPDGQRRPTRW